MIKALTFDVDMTLVDFFAFKKAGVKAAADAMIAKGFKGSRKTIEQDLFDFYLEHGIESNDIFTAFLKKNNDYSDRVLAAAINAYLKSKYRHLKSYPGVKKTLAKLRKKGYKLAVITDAPRLKAYMRLDELGIADYFDFVVGVEDTGRTKPSRLPFRKALKSLGVKPSEVLHTGDWRDKDVLGAKQVGMKSCIARYGDMKMGRKVWADYYINNFEEILDVVEKENSRN